MRRVALLICVLRRKQTAVLSLLRLLLGFLGLDFLEGFDLLKDLVRLPLGPEELVVRPLFEVAH